ncbi:MAG: hypothetical protein ACUVV0_07365 [Anaerolineae bacterium]
MKPIIELIRSFGVGLSLFFTFWGLVGVACAQAPPIEVSKVAGWEAVSAGGELAYLIIITNTSSSPLSGITVRDIVPENTTVLGTSSSGGEWWIATRSTEEGLEIVWQSREPLPPRQVARLGFVVKTDATSSEPIVSPACRVTVEGWDSPVPCNRLKTEVAPTTPTSTPVPAPTETFTASPTATKPEPATSAPELTPTLPPTSMATTPAAASPRPRTSVPQAVVLAGGILVVAILLIGSILLLKRR